MKRIFALVITFVVMFAVFTGCESTPIRTCISEVDGEYILTLPESKKTIRLENREVRFVPYITDQLVKQAENKIMSDAEKYDGDNKSGFYLYINEDYLCLTLELIVLVDDPAESGGCGDHKHVFFYERISTEAVKDEANIVPGVNDPDYKKIQFFPNSVLQFEEEKEYDVSDFKTSILTDSDIDVLRMAYADGRDWVDDSTVDRIAFHFDGRIRFATGYSINWMYFGFEDNVLYYNGKYTEISDIVMIVLEKYKPTTE